MEQNPILDQLNKFIDVNEVRSTVIKEFSKCWELNDAAHRIRHFDEVEQCALHINRVLGLNQEHILIMLAAYFHDLFAWSRENHHLLSCEFIRTSEHPIFNGLKDSQRSRLSIACKHHRASYDGKFIYTLDELINSADRGFPSEDIGGMVQRSLQYTQATGLNRTATCNQVLYHLKEKFGTGGYARYPAMYVKAFGETLELQRKKIDALTINEIQQYWVKYLGR